MALVLGTYERTLALDGSSGSSGMYTCDLGEEEGWIAALMRQPDPQDANLMIHRVTLRRLKETAREMMELRVEAMVSWRVRMMIPGNPFQLIEANPIDTTVTLTGKYKWTDGTLFSQDMKPTLSIPAMELVFAGTVANYDPTGYNSQLIYRVNADPFYSGAMGELLYYPPHIRPRQDEQGNVVGDVRLTLRWRTGCPWNATYREPTAPPYVPAPNLPYNFDYLTDDSGQRVYASDDFSVIGQVEGFGEFVAAP